MVDTKWITIRLCDREVKVQVKSLDEVLEIDFSEEEEEENKYQSET